MMKQNLILIGFMGAGKTTIGRLFAEKNHLPMVDTDQLIVEKAGMSIPRIFEQQGEHAFRVLETEVLKQLLIQPGCQVISVGGGLPMREENRMILSQLGRVVYLELSEDTVWKRLEGNEDRPLLQGDDAVQRITTLLSARRPIYELAAHQAIRVDDKSPEEIVQELERVMGID